MQRCQRGPTRCRPPATGRAPRRVPPGAAQAVRRGVRRRQARRRPRRRRSRSPGRSPTVVRSRRPGRDRRRRRQLLPRRRAAAARHGPRPRRLHGHARHGHELPGAAGLPGEGRASRPGCRPRSRWARSPSPTSRAAPIRHLEKGRVVIFGAGAGMPYFSTDTVAAQRALEIGCRGAADGQERRRRRLRRRPAHQSRRRASSTRSATTRCSAAACKVADATAFSLCRDNELPIVVFDLHAEGNIARAVRGEKIGTLVGAGR